MKVSSLVCLFIFCFSAFAFTAGANQWSKVEKPTGGGHAFSIGTYTAGCLSGAEALPINGNGYQVMRLSRKRYYGHPHLIQFIKDLSSESANRKLGTLLIGDLGQPRGGPTLTGHRSHQTGLDVDIWFLLSPQANARILANNERENWGAPSVLLEHSDSIDSRQWSRSNEQVLELAARMPEVDRIFVNPSIKKQLCGGSRTKEWLRKIRPWWKHDDHFHVRLRCSADSPDCRSQEPLPSGDGCDASLAWWFSAEAKAPAKKGPPPRPPELPALCRQVLQQ